MWTCIATTSLHLPRTPRGARVTVRTHQECVGDEQLAVFDKTAKRLQITATIEPETAALLASDPQPDRLWGDSLRGWDSNPQPLD